jgi:hypothetical protein
MQLSLDSYLIPAPGIVQQTVKDEAVLILPERGEIKVLNEVGASIWALLDGRHTIGDVANMVYNTYDTDQGRAQTDVLQFISDLVRRNMLVVTLKAEG